METEPQDTTAVQDARRLAIWQLSEQLRGHQLAAEPAQSEPVLVVLGHKGEGTMTLTICCGHRVDDGGTLWFWSVGEDAHDAARAGRPPRRRGDGHSRRTHPANVIAHDRESGALTHPRRVHVSDKRSPLELLLASLPCVSSGCRPPADAPLTPEEVEQVSAYLEARGGIAANVTNTRDRDI